MKRSTFWVRMWILLFYLSENCAILVLFYDVWIILWIHLQNEIKKRPHVWSHMVQLCDKIEASIKRATDKTKRLAYGR